MTADPGRPDDAPALHRCPIDGCETRIAWDLATCRDHWRLVPRELAALLYRTWKRGRGYGTKAHSDALDLCVTHVNGVIAERKAAQPKRLF